MNRDAFPLQAVVDYALATEHDAEIRRDLSKGLDPNLEQYAYKHVCPRVERRDEHRALKIIGLLSASGLRHDQEITFGQWCSGLDAGQTERRLLALQNLPFDQAIKEIKRLLDLGRKSNQGFNWYDLSQTLYFWGRNRSEGARRVRLKILSDYYRNPRGSFGSGEDS